MTARLRHRISCNRLHCCTFPPYSTALSAGKALPLSRHGTSSLCYYLSANSCAACGRGRSINAGVLEGLSGAAWFRYTTPHIYAARCVVRLLPLIPSLLPMSLISTGCISYHAEKRKHNKRRCQRRENAHCSERQLQAALRCGRRQSGAKPVRCWHHSLIPGETLYKGLSLPFNGQLCHDSFSARWRASFLCAARAALLLGV